jgi:hypothetical protein
VILASNRPPVEKLRAVELAVYRPTQTRRPVHLGPKGWPLLQGTTWEIHDDPEMTRSSPATGAGKRAPAHDRERQSLLRLRSPHPDLREPGEPEPPRPLLASEGFQALV